MTINMVPIHQYIIKLETVSKPKSILKNFSIRIEVVFPSKYGIIKRPGNAKNALTISGIGKI